ncbi:MAG TPA: TadE/TadG family type IV pilus assembly protein [Acidimicrobiales bacterium]|nr:TadE/TadG family type IV pilus assembly protein [Acidimicrobiales bacterium]
MALVEFALVLPVVALLMGAAFTGWNGMQLSVRLTSAARAGAIQAAADLGADQNGVADALITGAQQQSAWDDATQAVNNEEGTTGVYQDTDPGGADYVAMALESQAVPGSGGTITLNVVKITISDTAVTLVPVVGNLAVNTTATARYS